MDRKVGRPRARRLLVLWVIGITLVAFEVVLRVSEGHTERARDGSPEPYYMASTYTFSRQDKISQTNGPLKLVLDPFLNYRNLPNQQGPWFRTNSRGYRGAEVDLTPGVRRLVLVGGSAAFGTGVRSDDETFARALERKLARTQVINAAVIGHLSTEELTLLRQELLDLEPTLVMAFDGINDSRTRPVNNMLLSSGFYQNEEILLEHRRLKTNPLRALANVFESLVPYTAQLARRAWTVGRWLPEIVTGSLPKPADLSVRVRIYTDNLEKMARLARARGVPMLVMIQPQRSTGDRLSFDDKLYAEFAATASRILREKGIEVMNLQEWGEWRREHFTDDIHLTAAGSELLAERMARHIQERKLL